MSNQDTRLLRAQGCLVGQLAGDSLGGLVEFMTAQSIRQRYPGGVRQMADGGTWNTLAGQPTDDSEMALMLARMLAETGTYSAEAALKAYRFWLDSRPFDCGGTTRTGLQGQQNPHSQANGALMRISPLGIFGAGRPLADVESWAMQDAALTHPHPVCQQANALFAGAIAEAIHHQHSASQVYEAMLLRARTLHIDPTLMQSLEDAAHVPPADYQQQQGWVLIAFQNAIWQMLHAPNLEEAVVDTIGRGGDTDTNAAICGALLGAVHGLDAVPTQWLKSLQNCRPQAGKPGVFHPRPQCFWPVDALELGKALLPA